MKTTAPISAGLRQSAAALVQLADSWEAEGRYGGNDQASEPDDVSPPLLTALIERLITESARRRQLLRVGAMSDEALSLLLLAFATPEKSITIDSEQMTEVTGLPSSVCLRLLAQLSHSGLIELRHPSVEPTLVWFKLRHETKASLTLYLANTLLNRLAQS